MSQDLAFAAVVDASTRLGATRSRLEKARIIAELLEAAAGQVPVVVGFISGEPRQGKVGVGYAQAFGNQTPSAEHASLTVGEVDDCFTRVAAIGGTGSASRRAEALTELLGRATAAEADLIRRMLVGEVRHGALEGSVLDAVIRAGSADERLVRRAAMLSGDLGAVAEMALAGDIAALESVALAVMRPVLPMLASTASTVAEAVERFQACSVEWKLDGARIQVHRIGDEVAVYTRNQNDVTARLPEVVAAVSALAVGSVVLDGEAMAVDPSGRASPFQETMSRFGADTGADDLPVMPFFFDILHLDGDDLLDRPLSERRRLLEATLPEPALVPALRTSDSDAAERFLAEARALRHEGVMVKDLSSTYEAGRRGASWLKVKPVHTLDLAIIAAEWGHGRRTGWLSNLHLGARDPATGEFVMLGKTFKGLTDAMLAFQTGRLLELEVRRTRGTVFVRPELIVEVAFDGLLPSPRYPGGMSLRFARVRGFRTDKAPEDADTIETVQAIFEGRRAI
jgi:DNA ligase 1